MGETRIYDNNDECEFENGGKKITICNNQRPNRFTQLKMAHLIQLYMYYEHLYTFQLLSFEFQ